MNITKDELLRNYQEKLPDIILALVKRSSDAGKHLKGILAACDPDPKKSISIIKKEIAALKNSRGYVSQRGCSNLSHQIKQMRAQIMEDVLPKSPNDAVTLLRSLLAICNDTLERADDGGGEVGDAFIGACKDIAKAYEHATYPQNKMVDFVYKCVMNNGYCIYDSIISDFKTTLGSRGLQALKRKFQKTKAKGAKEEAALGEIADALNNVDA